MSRIQQRRCGLEALCGYDEVFDEHGFYLQVWPIGHPGLNVIDIGYAKPVSMVELCATAPNAIVGLFLLSPVVDLMREHERERDRVSEVDWREGMPAGLWS